MSEVIRSKLGGYCGIENVKFSKREKGVYATKVMNLLYAQGLKLTPKIGETPQNCDNKLLFKIPSDKGLEGELRTTAPDPELDKAAGFAIEGANGLIDVDMTSYVHGALYFEFIGHDGEGVASRVKVWLLNVELGKGEKFFNTSKESVELGDYAYSLSVNGDPMMNADGTTPYLDKRGMGHLAFQYTAYPEDPKYADFEKSVPVPTIATPVTPPETP